MIITLVEEVSKSRCRIYVDGEFAFVLYKGELRLYGIRQDAHITEESYQEIMTKVLPKRAKMRAMNLLKSREYTEKQLHDKLRDGGYPESVISQALEYVASYHYTDDLRYAVTYITDHESSRSRRRIEQDLLGKGIAKHTLSEAWLKWEEQGGFQNESVMIAELLKKRGFDADRADRKEVMKTYAFLMRKGFSPDAIRKALFSSGMDYFES